MMNTATHIQRRKFSWRGGEEQSFAKFRHICFDFAYFFNGKVWNHGKVRKWQKRFFTKTTYQTIRHPLYMRMQYSCILESQSEKLSAFAKLQVTPTFSTTSCAYCINVAIFIILESQSEKLWHQNYKLRPQNYKLRLQNYKLRLQNYKLRSQNYKLRPQDYKLRVQNLQVWQLKLISFNWLICYS